MKATRMAPAQALQSWLPDIQGSERPVYVAIADAIAAGIRSGDLPPGTRLPPQRRLADQLGVDFTTITRAYTEAKRRGLVEGKVGIGTYVRPPKGSSVGPGEGGMIDMSMNLPPRFDNDELIARMWSGISSLRDGHGVEFLLQYQVPGGTATDRASGARWLASRLPTVTPERILICGGAQAALLATVDMLTQPDDVICIESLTFPGFRALATHLGRRLVPVTCDQDGLIPEAFADACRRHAPKALYCTPTLHNPTTATMPESRRDAIARIAEQYGVVIIEDDAYGMLPKSALAPLASFAPQSSYYIASLAKCLSPALRIAYVATPDARAAARLTGAIRATAAMASPLTSSVASRWLDNGTAAHVLTAIRKETAARYEIARSLLPVDGFHARPDAFHAWLRLPEPWTRGEFVGRLRTVGIGVIGSDAFALSDPAEAVRLSLGAPATQADLRHSLEIVADLLLEQPGMSTLVV